MGYRFDEIGSETVGLMNVLQDCDPALRVPCNGECLR